MKCSAISCNHNTKSHRCKFYRFPKNNKTDLTKWSKICKRRPNYSHDRLCSCHFQDGIKKNEPRLAIKEECSISEKLSSPEIISENEIGSPSLGDIRLQVSLRSEPETNSILLEAAPVTCTLIRNRIQAPFDHSSVSRSISELTTGSSLAEVSDITVQQNWFETERCLCQKEKAALVHEKNHLLAKNLLLKQEIEKMVQKSRLEAERCLWEKEKKALVEERNRLLAENLLLREEIENMTDR